MHWIRTSLVAASLAVACEPAMGGPQNRGPITPLADYDQPAPYAGPQAPQNPYTPSPQNQSPDPYPQNQQPTEDQNAPQAQSDADDDAAVESFEWVTGKSRLGVVVMQMTRDLRAFFRAPPDRGVLVAHVEPRSAAARAGIRVGDVILNVGNQAVTGADDVIAALDARPGGRVRLGVIRGGQLQELVANLPRPRAPQDRDSQPML